LSCLWLFGIFFGQIGRAFCADSDGIFSFSTLPQKFDEIMSGSFLCTHIDVLKEGGTETFVRLLGSVLFCRFASETKNFASLIKFLIFWISSICFYKFTAA
jgi:hypothetical protein